MPTQVPINYKHNGEKMNKNELINAIAEKADVTVIDAKKCLEAFTSTLIH